MINRHFFEKNFGDESKILDFQLFITQIINRLAITMLYLHNLHYEKFSDGALKCIEDSIPFKIPNSWSWERLGNISSIARGGSPRPINDYLTNSPEGVNWIKIGDTEKDGKYIYKTKEKIKKEGISKSRLVHKGDFLLTNSMSFGRPYILKTDGCIHDGWLVIGNIDGIFDQDYLYYALSSNFMYAELSKVASGSTVQNLKSDTVKNVLFPIPPIHEQKIIASKISSLLNFIDRINEGKEDLITIIQKTKSKILDLAIRGKLVLQDSNDEPASVLLERIRQEKEELIKSGKLKRDKRESVIFRGEDNSYYEKFSDGTIRCIDDELPFKSPKNWMWCELQDCCSKEIKRGRAPKYADEGNVLAFAQKCNRKTGEIDISTALWLDRESTNRYSSDEYMLDGDIVINSTGTGTLGRIGIYRDNDNPHHIPIVPDSHVTVVRAAKNIEPSYLFFYLKFMQRKIEEMGEGSTNQKELKPLTIQKIRLPIPPYEEQQRIVKLVHSLTRKLSSIEESLTLMH